jgi:hypothetical protein
MGLKDIRRVKCLNAINHHPTASASHDSDRKARVVIFSGRDVIQAVLREELRPTIDLTIIQGVSVRNDKLCHIVVKLTARLRGRFFKNIVHGATPKIP